MVKKVVKVQTDRQIIKTNYNVCIVDESYIFAMGLKKNIKKINFDNRVTYVFVYKSIQDIIIDKDNPIDLLFVDYNLVLLPGFNTSFNALKKNNPKLKIIVNSNDLIKVDFIRLYSYNINGFFSKGLTIKSFVGYMKKIMSLDVYIDYYSITHFVNREKKQMLKSYYKSVALHNLGLIQNEFNHQYYYNIDRDAVEAYK